MKKNEKEYWQKYQSTNKDIPKDAFIEASMAGNEKIAEQLLDLYLKGKKTAGSSLVKDFLMAQDPLPKAGNYWIILNAQKKPKCIVKTISVEIHLFENIPERIAIAEGEGDLSLSYWKQEHQKFFASYFSELKIKDLNKEKIVTEFFKLVFSES